MKPDLEKLSKKEKAKNSKYSEYEKKFRINEINRIIQESVDDARKIDKKDKKEKPKADITRLLDTKNNLDEEERRGDIPASSQEESKRLEKTVEKSEERGNYSRQEMEEYQFRMVRQPTEDFYNRVIRLYEDAIGELNGNGNISDETRENLMNMYAEQKIRENNDKEGIYNIPDELADQFNTARKMVRELFKWYRI